MEILLVDQLKKKKILWTSQSSGTEMYQTVIRPKPK